MLKNYTDNAREIRRLAIEEARSMQHKYIGTEHILLALSKGAQGKVARILEESGIDYETVRSEIEKLVKPGEEKSIGNLRETPRVRKVWEYSDNRSTERGGKEVDTEDILYGLLEESEGIGAQVLMNLGFTLTELKGLLKSSLYGPLKAAGYLILGRGGEGFDTVCSSKRELLGHIRRIDSPPGEKVSLLYTLSTLKQVLDLRDWLKQNHVSYTEENPDAKKVFEQTLREEASERNKLADRLEEKVQE